MLVYKDLISGKAFGYWKRMHIYIVRLNYDFFLQKKNFYSSIDIRLRNKKKFNLKAMNYSVIHIQSSWLTTCTMKSRAK